MQPIHLDVGSDVLASSTTSAALDAYLADDLAECLRLLDGASADAHGDDRLAHLVRARALLRLQRSAEVLDLIGPILGSFAEIDEALTARMLHAVAVFRTVSLDRGIALLLEVASAARALGAHRTIQAEIAYWTASAYWRKRDYEATLAHAQKAEDAQADVISVRAATLRGYVAAARERFPEALAVFHAARQSYDQCRERDFNLLERIVVQIASLEVTLRSNAVGATHMLAPGAEHEAEARARRIPGVLRMQIMAMDAWLYAFDDDQTKAYRQVRIAEDLAPNTAWRMWALANRANIALAFGDLPIGRELAEQAREIADALDWNDTADEERVGLLFLAEALTVTDPLRSVEVLRRYDRLTTEIDRGLLFHDDIRLWIVEKFVRGLVHRVRGDAEAAWNSLKEAHDASRRVGYLWRAALALIEMDATPLLEKPRGVHDLHAAALLVHEHFPGSFLTHRLGRWGTAYQDPVFAVLTPQLREVMRHLLSAKTTKEIAPVMSIAEGTVRNYFKELFLRFGVHSRDELLVVAYQRGIGDPSWWDVSSHSARASTSTLRARPSLRPFGVDFRLHGELT
jgi:DNA-binding CsgD family transcriptional regulator/tetratricopeptide (TPR) repeat protein